MSPALLQHSLALAALSPPPSYLLHPCSSPLPETPPKYLLHPLQHSLASETRRVLRCCLRGVRTNELPQEEFWDWQHTLEQLSSSGYFLPHDRQGKPLPLEEGVQERDLWPHNLQVRGVVRRWTEEVRGRGHMACRWGVMTWRRGRMTPRCRRVSYRRGHMTWRRGHLTCG